MSTQYRKGFNTAYDLVQSDMDIESIEMLENVAIRNSKTSEFCLGFKNGIKLGRQRKQLEQNKTNKRLQELKDIAQSKYRDKGHSLER